MQKERRTDMKKLTDIFCNCVNLHKKDDIGSFTPHMAKQELLENFHYKTSMEKIISVP
jgi:hypothetical protein